MQEEHQHLPNTDRLSVLAASILLAYAMLPFIKIPDRILSLQILGAVFSFKINFATIIGILSGGLAAAGVSWLLLDHPYLNRPGALRSPDVASYPGSETDSEARGFSVSRGFFGILRFRGLFQHWLLPALTAWVIGVPLNSLAVGLQWWAVFGFGGLLLVLVLLAEYIAVDPYDSRHGPAAVGLTAVSYALFLTLTIALVAAGSRLYILLPGLIGAIFLVTLRTLYLRLGGRWCIAWSAGIALVVGQVAAALHYWPLFPLRFGLVILGLAYALASVAGSIEEGRTGRSIWVEPAVMLAALWGLAVLLQG
jgi:Protein of unknown function (DUF5656)